MEYTVEQLEQLKKVIEQGQASPSQITEYGYATQPSKQVDKNKFNTGGTK